MIRTDTGLTGYGEVASAATRSSRPSSTRRWSASHRHGLGAFSDRALNPLDPTDCWARMYEASRWYGRRGVAIHALSGDGYRPLGHRREGGGQAHLRHLGPSSASGSCLCERPLPGRAGRGRRHDGEVFLGPGFTAVKFGYGSFGRDRSDTISPCWRAITDAARGRHRPDGRCRTSLDRASQAIDRGQELFDRFGIVWLEEPIGRR